MPPAADNEVATVDGQPQGGVEAMETARPGADRVVKGIPKRVARRGREMWRAKDLRRLQQCGAHAVSTAVVRWVLLCFTGAAGEPTRPFAQWRVGTL